MKSILQKVMVVFVIFVILLAFMSKDVNSFLATLSDDEKILVYDSYEGLTTETTYSGINVSGVVATLEGYGYEIEETATSSVMQASIAITVHGVNSDGSYNIWLGDNEKTEQKEVKYGELVKIYGYTGKESDLAEGTSWDVNLILTCEVTEVDWVGQINGYSKMIKVYATAIYTDKVNLTEEEQNELNAILAESKNLTYLDVDSTSDALVKLKNFVDALGTGWDFFVDLASNPVETLFSLFLDLLIGLGDLFQMLANMVQTVALGTVSDWTITYTYNELENETVVEDTTSTEPRNMYTNVGSYGQNSEGWQKTRFVNGSEEGYSYETEIPVIPVDIYNMAIGNIDFLDVNFFSSNDSGHSSAWMTLRNFATGLMRATIYVGSAVILMTLIWHGIHIVSGSITPKSRLEHKEGLVKFAISLLMLVGTVVIMTLCIFASDLIMGDLKSDTYELPIRVNVKSAGYSFSTNVTGFARYMSQIDNVDLCGEKAPYALTYFGLTVVNLIAVLFMIARMVIMLILSIIGPIIAVLYALNKEDSGENYKTWVKLYAVFASVQIIFAIVTRIILEVAIWENTII